MESLLYLHQITLIVNSLHRTASLDPTLGIPFQAAPVRLGRRYTPPDWNHELGWTYTFQACPSNFMDCYFLDHSPCPKIDIFPPENPLLEPARYKDLRTLIEPLPAWYKAAVGYGVDKPDHSVGDTGALPATHVAYSYLFRPKYHIRREVQRRVERFHLDQDSCATMHVRRGDSGKCSSVAVPSLHLTGRTTAGISPISSQA